MLVGIFHNWVVNKSISSSLKGPLPRGLRAGQHSIKFLNFQLQHCSSFRSDEGSKISSTPPQWWCMCMCVCTCCRLWHDWDSPPTVQTGTYRTVLTLRSAHQHMLQMIRRSICVYQNNKISGERTKIKDEAQTTNGVVLLQDTTRTKRSHSNSKRKTQDRVYAKHAHVCKMRNKKITAA